ARPLEESHVAMKAGFLAGPRGPLFYVLHAPAVLPPRGSVLFAHPFGDEHNKARRMVAYQARALAAQGFAVLVPDLYGCGDSAGEFAAAEWAGWQDDLRACFTWLRAEYPAPLTLWGL